MFSLHVLSAIASAIAIALVASTALAGLKLPANCAPNRGNLSNCVPILACLGDSGIFFTGRAIGWGKGTHAGQTSANFGCHGQWRAQGSFGFGEATLECDNGLTGKAFFTYQHPETGTASGIGRLSTGEIFHVWSGNNVDQFLINKYGEVDAGALCQNFTAPGT
ncbi:hypothetical protein [uncultured Ruegeria sp.]|uniref:hypothetical protein n=1 Tax=uncultured Ruegeria sp. TaxID=259304 RepID=UPI00260AEA0B|nr:hypothetical protein [uncultured Ruegeria sp.]